MANQLGLNGTITYPDGETLDVKDGKNFFKLIMGGYDIKNLNAVPITVETDNPDLFWQIWNDTANRGGGGGESEQRVASLANWSMPDTPGEHFLDTMEITADRRDYEHWNEDADYMWWNEEGKHQDEAHDRDYDDEMSGRYDDMMEAAAEEGYQAAYDTPPDALTVPYDDADAISAFLDGYQDGRVDAGYDSLTPEEYQALSGIKPSRYDLNPEERAFNAMGSWTRQAITDIESVGTPADIPYDPSVEQSVVHAYPDGDVILQDGTTTFNPERAYGFLVGQKEFDKAQQVKELIDRSGPTELPGAVIPPEEAVAPNTRVSPTNPGEAPLDPTGGGQASPEPPAGAGGPPPEAQSGAPTQPGLNIPGLPGLLRRQQPGRPMTAPQSSVEKEARKDYTHSEQKELIDENLEGRARNYEKLNLDGTHYELEQESSFDDLL